MQHETIPQVLATGCFTSSSLLRLLRIDEAEGPTYALQYFADSIEQYDLFINQYEGAFRRTANNRWGQGFVDFQTLMEVVN